jgi:abelson tyrosine-protein kinase 1
MILPASAVSLFIMHAVMPDGTLRWQAPEILSGESMMTSEADVYAFAIVCVEVLTFGELPWALLDDQAVQQLVLRMHVFTLDFASN